MNTLFPSLPLQPEGFQYYPDFLSKAEEDYLLQLVKRIELKTFVFQGYEAKRKVASFGYDWDFQSRTLSQGRPIPGEFQPLISKCASLLSFDSSDLAELLVTEYAPGTVINWHRDAPPFDAIIGVSLNSDCKFRFRRYDKGKQGRGSIISLDAKRRSAYVIQGPARSDWEHSIAPVKELRYSITLRTLKPTANS
ncbi:alpha-ketoglutarate-dependent dioxygenase AlkB [Pedobacter sp. SYSU D00535]|uniref:alpha-ketoglutarate-dependent dioxygenase AlkB n=1 Tax=Pedobacter sp. SYSU D00535 TaxID=2810308 RepID=UPI001A978A90|nr:alpha-ketoglutarate-dependent dioxygenase AlkB [Pedobacter sp. SYSU D00535]